MNVKDVANHCSTVLCNKPCDTCDSKKAKTPVVRARARTRESVFKICLRCNFLQKTPHTILMIDIRESGGKQ